MKHFWVIKDTGSTINYGLLLTTMDHRSVLQFQTKAEALEYVHGRFTRCEWSRYKPVKAWITTRQPKSDS